MSEREALVERLKSLKVLLGTDSPEVRGWAPAVQQEAQKIVNATIAALTAQQEPVGGVHIVFDGPPSNESGRFVEVETPDGRSISWGRWEQRGKYWHLIAPQPADGVVVPREGMLQAAKWLENEAAKSVNRREYLLAATALLAAAKEPR